MAESYPNDAGARRRRRALFFGLYFCEGAPIGFLWWALPVLLYDRGVGDEASGALLALLVLPWALKFLWAPAVDVLRGPRFGLRAWIVTAQAAMVGTLLPLLWLDELPELALLTPLLLAHAVAAATQDVAIDALAIQETPPAERGSVNGWMQAGMLLARAAFGGGFLLVRDRLGDRGGVALLAGTVAAGALALLVVGRVESAAPARSRGCRSFGRTLRGALALRSTWLALAFAATAGAGFEAVGGFAGRLLRARGLALGELGWQFAVQAGLLALGALAGGRLADRAGRRRATALSGLLLAGFVFAFAAAAGFQAAPPLLLVALELVYLGIGLFTASSYALFMDLTDPRLGSTQFSATMGATNLCESWSVWAAGGLIVAHGHGLAFGLLGSVSLAALLLVPLLRPASPARTP